MISSNVYIYIYTSITPGMYGKPPTVRFARGFSKAGFGHAALFFKNYNLGGGKTFRMIC